MRKVDNSNYLFTHGEDNSGRRFTIAAKLEKQHVKIGVSVCSLQENFCKKTGRNIAKVRAVGRPVAVLDVTETADDKALREVAFEKMFEIKAVMEEDAAKLWVRNS